MIKVDLDDQAIFEMLNSADGPVGQLMAEMSAQIATVARSVVRVRRTASRSPLSTAMPPGYTKASITEHVGWDKRGHIYGGANAKAHPGLYLEYPARQMSRAYPFLTTGLMTVEGLL